MRQRSRAACIVTALVLAGCSDATGPGAATGPPPPPDVSPYVTGAALSSLDSQGHFRLPNPEAPGPYAILSPEDASRIALGVIRTWFANPDVLTIPGTVSLAEAVEEDRGRPIDWSHLQLGLAGPYFAESSVEPAPPEMGNPAIRYWGPFYLIPLFEGAEPAVVVAVSAYATNLELDTRGFVQRRDNLDGGNEFRTVGVPLQLQEVTLPPSPEVAVRFAFEQTGVRIAGVPVLGVPGNRVSPTGARWQLQLAEPREFERIGDGSRVTTDTVYVGVWPSIVDHPPGGEPVLPPRLRLFIAGPDQPEAEDFGDARLPIRPGYVVNVTEARLHE